MRATRPYRTKKERPFTLNANREFQAKPFEFTVGTSEFRKPEAENRKLDISAP